MKNNLQKAFTLVELIVVITILAILATVGFLSFHWYSSKSRDVKRIADVVTIAKWLQVLVSKNSKLPEPSENKVIVGSGSTNLIIQWKAWKSVLSIIWVFDAKDPLDNLYYTYSTNKNYTKYQIMALLENNPLVKNINIHSKAYTQYSNRFKYIKWDKVWIISQPITNIPLNELETITQVDLSNDVNDYIISFWTNDSSTASGWNLYDEIINKTILGNIEDQNESNPAALSWIEHDTNCLIDDIILWNQTWAWCNSTLWDWFEWWKQNNGSDGSISTCYDYDANNNASDLNCSIWNQLMKSNANPKDFFDIKQPDGKNNNQDSEFDTIWWKLYTWEEANDSACPAGWHLPSDWEWEILETYLNWWTNCRNSTDWWQCEGLWWNGHNAKNNSNNLANNLANALKLPLAGFRGTDNSMFYHRGAITNLWSSTTTSSTLAYNRGLHRSNSTVNRYSMSKVQGFSVRCIKD